MNTIPKNLKGGQYWHVIYECRPDIILINPKCTGFFALGQDAVWDLSAVSEWINEVDIAHVEYDGVVEAEYGYQSDYCLTCGSCGIDGCCPPTRCAVFTCRHSKTYFEDYQIMQKQWSIMHDFIRRLSEDAVDNIGQIEYIASDVLKEVDDLFNKPNTINDHRDS